jgi:hypothetical protein
MAIREPLLKYFISIAITVGAAISGYYAAYTGLRVDLANKAEERYVAELDIRLARLETTISERFATRDDLSSFKADVITKLSAIEGVIRQLDRCEVEAAKSDNSTNKKGK